MMKRRTAAMMMGAGIAVLVAVIVYLAAREAPVAAVPAGAAKILYWYDPMHPQQHFDKPGKSPFMDMQLVPKYAQEAGAAEAAGGGAAAPLNFDARNLQRLGVRLATVARGVLSAPVSVVGNLAFNERDTIVLQARSAGFVQRVYDLAVGDVVERGAPLVDLLVPEWLGVQQEILALQAAGETALLAAARSRALALGMPAESIARIERTRRPSPVFTVAAPRTGAIKTLDVRAGMSVAAGAPLATINGIERIWLEMAVPQALAQSIAVGDAIEASFAALPAQRGTIEAILPESDAATRTLRVRAVLENPRAELRPGLLAQVRFVDRQGAPALLVPSAAIIRGGAGDRVIVAAADGAFHAVSITAGREDGERSEIVAGLEEGQQVVASGQFLIDSEANLTGQLDRLQGVAPSDPHPRLPDRDQHDHGQHDHEQHEMESRP